MEVEAQTASSASGGSAFGPVQVRTTASIVLPHSSYSAPREKKARRSWTEPLNEECCSFSAAPEPSIRGPIAQSWQLLQRPGQPPLWSHGPRHSVLCDRHLARWATKVLQVPWLWKN